MFKTYTAERVKSGVEIMFYRFISLLQAIGDSELVFVDIGNLLRKLNAVLDHFFPEHPPK